MRKNEKFWEEGMDGKRFALCLLSRIWMVLLAALAGGALAAGIYLMCALLLAGPAQYQVFSQYRIYFDSEKYGEIQDYYNAYTWGEIMKTDQVVDFVMEDLAGKQPEITREQVKEAVSVGAMNDIKIMPLYVTTSDPQLSETIARAYVYGLDRFAASIEGLSGMDCWLLEPAVKLGRAEKIPNAAALGCLLGALAALAVLALYYCLDDSVYLEEDFSARFPVPVLGTLTRKKDPAFLAEYEANAACLLKGKENLWLVGDGGNIPLPEGNWQCASWPLEAGMLETMKKSDGVVLAVRWGDHNGRLSAHILEQLEKQGIMVLGAVIWDAEDHFLRAYYGLGAGRRTPRK